MAEGSMKLLWDCANALLPDTHTKRLLKSHYITTCRKIAKHQIQVPKEKFAVSQMCPRCSCFWSENEYRLKLKPQRLTQKAKAMKLIAKLQESQATQKKGLLTQKQRRRAKWLKKRTTSTVEILCEYCKTKSEVPLEKPKKDDKEAIKLQGAELNAESKFVNIKKKKKGRDKTAGLKINANAKSTNEDIKSSNPFKSTNSASKAPTAATTKKPPKQSEVVASTPLKGSLSQSSNAKKKKKASLVHAALQPEIDKFSSVKTNLSQSLKVKSKKKNKATTPTAAVVQKVQSKTQQQNSLLQLAALLKAQAKQTTANTSKNRLESLLK